MHLIESVFVETNQLFGINPNLILMQQTCGQLSGMAAGSKRRASAFYFFRTNLLYVPLIEMYRRVTSRSVDDFGTCKKNAAAQWRILTNLAAKHV